MPLVFPPPHEREREREKWAIMGERGREVARGGEARSVRTISPRLVLRKGGSNDKYSITNAFWIILC